MSFGVSFWNGNLFGADRIRPNNFWEHRSGKSRGWRTKTMFIHINFVSETRNGVHLQLDFIFHPMCHHAYWGVPNRNLRRFFFETLIKHTRDEKRRIVKSCWRFKGHRTVRNFGRISHRALVVMNIFDSAKTCRCLSNRCHSQRSPWIFKLDFLTSHFTAISPMHLSCGCAILV